MTLEELLKSRLGEESDITDLLEAFESEADARTNGLVKNKEKLLTQISKLKKHQAPEDLDVEAYQAYLEEKDKMDAEKAKLEEEQLAAAGQWDRLKGDMISTYESQIGELKSDFESKVSTLQNALDKELIENVAIKAIDKEQGNAALLLPHIKPHLKTVQGEDGNFSTQVVDTNGEMRLDPKTGEAFDVKSLVNEFKANETFAGAFPVQNSGSGLPAGQANKSFKGQVNPFKADTKNLTEQGRLRRENPQLAEQMAAAAGVK